MSEPTWGDMRFWVQVLRDSRRTVMCSPDLESRVKTRLSTFGLDGMFTVKVNRYLPDDMMLVIDEQAIQAEQNKPIKWDFGAGRAG